MRAGHSRGSGSEGRHLAMWLYAMVPVIVAAAGSIWTTFQPPNAKVVGGIQHFAAGVVFYAAAGEILPQVIHASTAVWPIVLGGGLGTAAMLFLRRATEKAEGPAGLIAASGADALIDGIVLGLAFAAGERQGILLAIALAIEFLFLGLSIAGAFAAGAVRAKVIGSAAGIALLVPVGVLVARPVGALPPGWQAAAFAFGLIALLYLVTEELLTEAHEKPETTLGAAMFFVGFIGLTVVDRLMHH